MGSSSSQPKKGSENIAVASGAAATAELTGKSVAPAVAPSRSGYKISEDTPQVNFAAPVVDTSLTDEERFEKYTSFRNELVSYSLGEAAFDYAERLYKKEPNSPAVMALMGDTAVIYDKTKNKHARDHWVDRLDLLQRGIDVSRKCMNENPDFAPCFRSYVACATRASESLYYYRWMRAVGLLENYVPIMKRGNQGLALKPDDVSMNLDLGMLNFRCVYPWYNPYRVLGWIYGVPPAKVLHQQGIQYLKKAIEADPQNMEAACRLGMAYLQAGDHASARRWYCKVRDEMVPRNLKDIKWQNVAHTGLSTGIVKPKWNVPFA